MSRKSVGYKTNLRSEDLGSVTDTTNDTHTARVGDCSGQLRARRNVHTCDSGL